MLIFYLVRHLHVLSLRYILLFIALYIYIYIVAVNVKACLKFEVMLHRDTGTYLKKNKILRYNNDKGKYEVNV